MCVKIHMNDIGVARKMRLGRCREHVSHRGVKIKAFDKDAKSEVNKKRSDKGGMKLLGGKCDKVVNRYAYRLSIRIFELCIIKARNLTV